MNERALVNQRLFFDVGTLYQRLAIYYYPPILQKAPVNPDNFKKLEDAVGFLDLFLSGQNYVAGDNFTLADISILSTISTLDVCGFDVKKYPNIHRWYETVKSSTPGYEIAIAGLEEFKKKFVYSRSHPM